MNIKNLKFYMISGKKRFTALALATVMSLSLTACGGEQMSSTPAPNPTASSTADADTSSVSTPESSSTPSGILDDVENDRQEVIPFSEEELNTLTAQFIKDLERLGIREEKENALYTVAVANIDHMIDTNPDLADRVFGGQDPEMVIGMVGHVIGDILTYNANNPKECFGISSIISPNTGNNDREKMEILESDLGTAIQASNNDNSSKAELTVTNMYYKIYDPEVGFVVDGKQDSTSLTNGAGFFVVVPLSSANFSVRNSLSKETQDLLAEGSTGEMWLSDIFTMMRGCQAMEIDQPKEYTK